MENTEKVVYLDNAATTACAPEALAVMVEALSGAMWHFWRITAKSMRI